MRTLKIETQNHTKIMKTMPTTYEKAIKKGDLEVQTNNTQHQYIE